MLLHLVLVPLPHLTCRIGSNFFWVVFFLVMVLSVVLLVLVLVVSVAAAVEIVAGY